MKYVHQSWLVEQVLLGLFSLSASYWLILADNTWHINYYVCMFQPNTLKLEINFQIAQSQECSYCMGVHVYQKISINQSKLQHLKSDFQSSGSWESFYRKGCFYCCRDEAIERPISALWTNGEIVIDYLARCIWLSKVKYTYNCQIIPFPQLQMCHEVNHIFLLNFLIFFFSRLKGFVFDEEK